MLCTPSPRGRFFAVTGASILGVAVLFAGLAACSSSTSDTGSSGSTPDASTSETSTDDASTADAADAGEVVVNDCKDFVDRSAASASRTITWDFPVSTAPERCMIIAKGQTVTFSGDFNTHPLLPGGGDSPNPVANVDATGHIVFPATGTFGFRCGVHPSMIGAIKVQ